VNEAIAELEQAAIDRRWAFLSHEMAFVWNAGPKAQATAKANLQAAEERLVAARERVTVLLSAHLDAALPAVLT
jgi:hypothetical protein